LQSCFCGVNRLSPLRLSGVQNCLVRCLMSESEPVKKKGGRPPSAKKRDKKINLYVTGLEELAIKKRAERAGLNLSDYCRQIVLTGQAQVRLTPAENALLNEATRLGNNLNQIAHKANADGIRSIAFEAQRLLKQLGQILDPIADDKPPVP
jgi:phage terminase Nu1 subunit (DNA packaging protein)